MPAAPLAYSETLRVPARWWLYGALFVIAVWWAFFVATPAWVALVGAVVAAALVAALLTSYGGVGIRVEPDGLRAGRAFVTWPYVGPVAALDAEETRRLTTVGADARAFLVFRAYCRGSVKVAILDPDDPAPYWLVSSRTPRRLEASLLEHRVED